VIADVGCRNTVFGAESQEGTKHLAGWLGAGVKHIRLEFVHESAEDVTAVIGLYQAGIAGTQTWTDIGRELRHAAPSGVTEGSFFVPDNYLVIPLR
jgi:putative protease